MKYLAILFLSVSLFANTLIPEKHPLYYAILKLRPNINKELAYNLSNLLHNKVRLAGLNPYRAIAIMMQESSIRNINVSKNGRFVDIGMFQFHYKTIELYKFDLDRLANHDLAYAVSCYVIVMKDKLKICRDLGSKAWSCYHSRTPKYRIKYIELVNNFYYEIMEGEDE